MKLEAEIPEVLYTEMKDFIGSNSNWDHDSLMSSALVNFLFQNGSKDTEVKDSFVQELFNGEKRCD